jgi:hypothetical protein
MLVFKVDRRIDPGTSRSPARDYNLRVDSGDLFDEMILPAALGEGVCRLYVLPATLLPALDNVRHINVSPVQSSQRQIRVVQFFPGLANEGDAFDVLGLSRRFSHDENACIRWAGSEDLLVRARTESAAEIRHLKGNSS